MCAPDVAVRVGACAGRGGCVGDGGRVGDGRGHGTVDAQGGRGFRAVGGGRSGAGDAARHGLSLGGDVLLLTAGAWGDCRQSGAWGGCDGDSDGSTGLFSSLGGQGGCDVGGCLCLGGDGGLAVCTGGVGCEERLASLRWLNGDGDGLLAVCGSSAGGAFGGFDYSGALVGGICGLERLVACCAILVIVVDIVGVLALVIAVGAVVEMVVVVAFLSHAGGHGRVAGIGLPAGRERRGAGDGTLGGERTSGLRGIGTAAGLRRTPLVVHGRSGGRGGGQCREQGDSRVTHNCVKLKDVIRIEDYECCCVQENE